MTFYIKWFIYLNNIQYIYIYTYSIEPLIMAALFSLSFIASACIDLCTTQMFCFSQISPVVFTCVTIHNSVFFLSFVDSILIYY